VTYFDIESPQAAKDASASRDQIIDIFNCIKCFICQLEIYTSITPTTTMTNMIVDVMVDVLTILVVATKETKCGQFSESIMPCILPFLTNSHSEKYFLKLTGKRDTKDSLERLDKFM
jgi:hypothetical protein